MVTIIRLWVIMGMEKSGDNRFLYVVPNLSNGCLERSISFLSVRYMLKKLFMQMVSGLSVKTTTQTAATFSTVWKRTTKEENIRKNPTSQCILQVRMKMHY